jgi:hypothetical protein
MTNTCELLINAVNFHKPKMLTGLNQKGMWSVASLYNGDTRTSWPPAKRRGLTHLVIQMEHGKPVSLPSGAGRPQGMLLEVRVEECGKSECRPVMGRIGVEPRSDITPRESGQTSTGSFFTKEFVQPSQGGKAR